MTIPAYGSLSIDFIGHTSDRQLFRDSRRALIVRRYRVLQKRVSEAMPKNGAPRLRKLRRARKPQPEQFSASVEFEHAGNPDYDISQLPESLLR